MPQTKKENFIFGLMMCTGMVIGMTFYNLFTSGAIDTVTWAEILLQLIMVFIIAALLEIFVVGPVAKKIAFSLPYDKSKKVLVIVTLALCMVSGMVLCMSLYGLLSAYLTDNLIGKSLVESYFSIVLNNVIFALPLQLLVVGPLVRFLFVRLIQSKRVTKSLPIS